MARLGAGLEAKHKALCCVLVPQQKAKDNRAAHRINKVQKVSGWLSSGRRAGAAVIPQEAV